jgi:hypothetical protein
MVERELANFPLFNAYNYKLSCRDRQMSRNTRMAGASVLQSAGAATRTLGLILELSECAPAWLECSKRRSKRGTAAVA